MNSANQFDPHKVDINNISSNLLNALGIQMSPNVKVKQESAVPLTIEEFCNTLLNGNDPSPNAKDSQDNTKSNQSGATSIGKLINELTDFKLTNRFTIFNCISKSWVSKVHINSAFVWWSKTSQCEAARR